MEYPHRRYLHYLLSRKLNSYELRADCLSKDLVPPNDEDLKEIAAELGDPPKHWRPRVERSNIPFRRWLRDQKLLPLWERDPETEEAFAFLHRPGIRKDFEAIVLAHGNVSQARKELAVKYTEDAVPSLGALKVFYEFFWNVGSMSSDGIMNYLTAAQARDDYIPALQGDLVTTYGVLGLQQRIKGETFLQNIMEAANQQALRLRANPNVPGATAAGIASVLKAGMDAHRMLEDYHYTQEGDSGIRQEAADFVVRVVQAREIPSIDELGHGDVIDAEYAEAGNVHRLTVQNK